MKLLALAAVSLLVAAAFGCKTDEPAPAEDFLLELTAGNTDELLSKLGSHLPDFECEERDLSPGATVDWAFECRGPAGRGFSGFDCRLYFEPALRWALCDQTVPLGIGESPSVCFVDTRGDRYTQGLDPYLDIRITCKGKHTDAVCSIQNYGHLSRMEVSCSTSGPLP